MTIFMSFIVLGLLACLVWLRELGKHPLQRTLRQELYYVYCWVVYNKIPDFVCFIRGHDIVKGEVDMIDDSIVDIYFCARCKRLSTDPDKLIPYE